MSQPYQEQIPTDKRPQADDQERLQYPGDEGKRPPLVQPDAGELIQGLIPRGGRGSGQHPQQAPAGDTAEEQPFAHEPTEVGEEPPIGNRKDIR